MADVYLDLRYKLDVGEKDMRLICLGLAGKLKRSDDIKDAAELNVRLLKAQKIRIGEQDTKIGGALRLAEEAHEAVKRVQGEGEGEDVQ
jgi:hypothetical protein